MIFDTTAYSALNRGHPEIVALLRKSDRLVLPAVVVAELLAGFKGGVRERENRTGLERFVAQKGVEIAFIDSFETLEQYARLQDYARRRGRALSNNDLWIASVAAMRNTDLITFDRDFMVLNRILGEHVKLFD